MQYHGTRFARALATGALLAGFSLQVASAQPAPSGALGSRPAGREQLARAAAVGNSTVQIKGMEFPKLASVTGQQKPGGDLAGQSSCCAIGATRHVPGRAEISAELPKGTRKDRQEMSESVYSPPLNCWIISRVTKSTENSIGPVSATEQLTPAGFSMLSASQFEAEQKKLETYVTNLKVDKYFQFDLNKKIEAFTRNYSSYATSISTSHGTLTHRALLKGAGLGKGRTAYKASYGVDEICCPPEVRDAAAFGALMRAWVDQTVQQYRNNLRSDRKDLRPDLRMPGR